MKALTLLTALYFASTPALANDFNLEAAALEFVATLDALAEGPEYLPGYRPADESYLIVDRASPTHFVAINLDCPASAVCLPLGPNPAKVSAKYGVWDRPIPEPLNTQYDFLYAQEIATDHPLRDFFRANPNRLAILEFFLPAPMLPGYYAPPGGFQFVYLHEGYHQFVQVGPIYGMPTPWTNHLPDLIATNRADTSFCRNQNHPAMVSEYAAQKIFFAALANARQSPNPDLGALKQTFLDWDAKKDARYSALPSAPPRNGRTTDCELLDNVYERVEGMADYAASEGLLRTRQIRFDDVVRNYRYSILDDPTAAPAADLGFYAAGAAYAFYLDILDPTGGWRTEITVNSRATLRALATRGK